MVLNTYTIINPRAMVIKPLHASITDTTMTAALSTNHTAVRTKLSWINNLKHFKKIYIIIF